MAVGGAVAPTAHSIALEAFHEAVASFLAFTEVTFKSIFRKLSTFKLVDATFLNKQTGMSGGNFQHIVAWSRTPNLCKSHFKPRVNKRVKPRL